MGTGKAKLGNFFEDFAVGQVLQHATPRTIGPGDVALYMGLYGPRFAVQSSDAFAQAIGYPNAPVDDLLAFHTVFGKTVPDVSLNAVANRDRARRGVLQHLADRKILEEIAAPGLAPAHGQHLAFKK